MNEFHINYLFPFSTPFILAFLFSSMTLKYFSFLNWLTTLFWDPYIRQNPRLLGIEGEVTHHTNQHPTSLAAKTHLSNRGFTKKKWHQHQHLALRTSIIFHKSPSSQLHHNQCTVVRKVWQGRTGQPRLGKSVCQTTFIEKICKSSFLHVVVLGKASSSTRSEPRGVSIGETM